MPANLWLCGPPGAGKSTLAPLLAARRGMRFADVDARIEARLGTPIATYVDAYGIGAFRERERATIAELARTGGRVIALGAGALEDAANRAAIAASGTLVHVAASVETCGARVARERDRRPLLREDGALERLHAVRAASYAAADVTVTSDGASPDAVAATLLTLLDERREIDVPLDPPYRIAIGPGVLDALPAVVAPEPGARVAIVTDTRVAPLAERIALAYREEGADARVHRVEANEGLKSLDGLSALYDAFAAAGLDRRGVVVGVGGGTIADAVGFAAATYMRGVRYAGVPTTLLAAVDAAIGGKTAINLPAGKNLAGTTTQPAHVAIAPFAFRSLDARDRLSGYAEMLKIGLALDAALYADLRAAEARLLADPATALDLMARCIAHKIALVVRDEDDRHGQRALLNFGHTVGHALERVSGYGALRHGEAVIVGMRAALALSMQRGLDARVRADADAHLAALPIDDGWRRCDRRAVVAATANDKKRGAAGTRFVLLDELGHARLTDGVAPSDVERALEAIGL